jgi:3',5'-nucleoside bisphosphate phosphatase
MAAMTLQHDLHSHSLASDGTLTPAGLVQAACAAGVNVLALTDHDTTDGIEEAARQADAEGLRLIPGVEISVSWESLTVHILGLGIDSRCETLRDGLSGLRAFRDWRAEEIGRRLERAGIHGAYAGACALSRGRIVSRTHFAHFLVANGHARSMAEVFKRFLTHGKPGYVSGQWASLEDALNWIAAAGGLPVIAHPARYPMTATRLRRLVGEFRELGGVGMEVVSGCHTRDDIHTMAGCARRMELFASRGSDYHGPENPWVQLGRLAELPAGCRPIWENEGWPVN